MFAFLGTESMHRIHATAPRSRRAAGFAAVLCALGLLGGGCRKSTPLPEAPRAAVPRLQFVEAEAPFIVDWDAQQMASLAAAVRSPNVGAVVVARGGSGIELLPGCALSGVYVPSGIGMYRGLLQVRNGGSLAMTAGVQVEALQQVSTSTNVATGTLLDYRFVVVGRHYLGGNRASAKLSELTERKPGGCRGATHFVRAALTGAFERMDDPEGAASVQTVLPGGNPHAMLPHGGDFSLCLTAGTAADAACGAFLKIELTALDP